MTTQAASIAELKTYGASMSDGDSLEILGYYTAGDGGGGTFYWDATSTDTDNDGTIIQATGVTTGRWLRVYDGAVNVKWFGAKIDGTTDDSSSIQTTLNSGISKSYLIPAGSYSLSDTISIWSSHIIIKIEGSVDLTGKAFPVFTLGENADGTLPGSSQYNITIDGLYVTGDRTAGSGAIKFRKASRCNIGRMFSNTCDYGVTGDGVVGGTSESILCRFTDCIFDHHNNGLYDAVGSFQGSSFEGCTFEANRESGILTKGVNLFFTDCTIEGNNKDTASHPQVHLLSGAGQISFVHCYYEASGHATLEYEALVKVDSVTARVLFTNCSLYCTGSCNYVVTYTVTGNTAIVRIDGGFCNGNDNYVNGAFAGDSGVYLDTFSQSGTITPSATTTVSGGAELIYSERTLGYVHSGKITGNEVVADVFRLSALNTGPSSASDTGSTGSIGIDANYFYMCVGTNTWKRAALSTW